MTSVIYVTLTVDDCAIARLSLSSGVRLFVYISHVVPCKKPASWVHLSNCYRSSSLSWRGGTSVGENPNREHTVRNVVLTNRHKPSSDICMEIVKVI